MATKITRKQALGFRVRAQQLDRAKGTLKNTAVLDFGVQDTGPDGGLWALAIRGVDTSGLSGSSSGSSSATVSGDLATLWTLRGAPHLYRRADVPGIAAAVQPFSEADAGKRIFDASKQLKAAGIGSLEGLDTVAAAMRSVVTKPTVKGEVSRRLSAMLDPPYLRFCRSCNATHPYEQVFRLGALRAGLELQPDTSPPVLQRIPGFKPPAATRPPPKNRDVVRAYLRLLGPATPKHVAEFLDAPANDVKAHWPSDAVDVVVDGETRWVLAEDRDQLTAGPAKATRLLGPYDLFLQGRDRALLMPDQKRSKVLWPVLGRPGAVLVDGEIVGTWRPRASGKSLKLQLELWAKQSAGVRTAITGQAEDLAAFRGVKLAGVD